eukprot:g11288.t1
MDPPGAASGNFCLTPSAGALTPNDGALTPALNEHGGLGAGQASKSNKQVPAGSKTPVDYEYLHGDYDDAALAGGAGTGTTSDQFLEMPDEVFGGGVFGRGKQLLTDHTATGSHTRNHYSSQIVQVEKDGSFSSKKTGFAKFVAPKVHQKSKFQYKDKSAGAKTDLLQQMEALCGANVGHQGGYLPKNSKAFHVATSQHGQFLNRGSLLLGQGVLGNPGSSKGNCNMGTSNHPRHLLHNSQFYQLQADQMLRKGNKLFGETLDQIMKNLSKCAIRRLARRGGVRRIARTMHTEVRAAFADWLEKIVRDMVTYVQHAGRATVKPRDVVHALKRHGRTIYGYNAHGS